MLVEYDTKRDLLYIRLDDQPQDVVNRRISDDVVLDIGADGRIVGIEIMDTSRGVNLRLGLECLLRELGPVDMLRFLQQFETGTGDYTSERHVWLDPLDVETIMDEIARRRRGSHTS